MGAVASGSSLEASKQKAHESLAKAPPRGLELDALALKVRECLVEASASGALPAALAVIERPLPDSQSEHLRIKACDSLAGAASSGELQRHVAYFQDLRVKASDALAEAAEAENTEEVRLKALNALSQAA